MFHTLPHKVPAAVHAAHAARCAAAKEAAKVVPLPDFDVSFEGTLVLLRPISEAAQDWAKEHLSHPETQRWGDAVIVEPRYIDAILDGIREEGLTIV